MPDHNRVFRAIRPCPRMRKVCLHRGRKGRPFAPNPQQAAFLRQRNRRIRKRRIWRSNRRKHVAIARASRGIRLYELVPRSAPRLLWFDSGRTSDLPARGGGGQPTRNGKTTATAIAVERGGLKSVRGKSKRVLNLCPLPMVSLYGDSAKSATFFVLAVRPKSR